jgi:membrane AbrB-like protein
VSLSGRGTGFQWGLLIALSAILAAVLELCRLPAALLLGPMIAGIVVATKGGALKIPRPPYLFAQGITACLIARGITSEIFVTFAQHGVLIVLVLVGILAACAGFGYLLMRWQVLPGTTAIWGCWPGGASAMVLMAESYGADARLVAFMQYLRVFLVAAVASIVGGLWVGAGPAPAAIIWFPPIHGFGLAITLGLGLFGLLMGIWGFVPAGAFILTLILGSGLHATGLAEIELPAWLLALTYACIGWNIGLGFTPQILAHAWRILPRILASILSLIAICGMFAVLLHVFAGVDPLTAYLATSPGGADSIAIIAASSHVDMSFVVALQTMRLFAVVLIGPHIAHFFARRAEKSEEPPTAPMD